MKHASLLSILFLFPFFALVGQATQSVTFNILPAESWVRVDGQVLDLSQQRTTSLKPGTYQIEIWAPEFAVATETLVVAANKPTVLTFGLRLLSSNYEIFREEQRRYNTAKLKRTIADVTFIGVTAGLSYAAITGRRSELNKLETQLENRRESYVESVNPALVAQFRNQYNQTRTEYNDTQDQHNTIVVTASVLAAAGTAATIWYFTKVRKQLPTKPVYTPDNPFVYSPPAPRPTLSLGTSTSLLGVSLKF